MKMLIPSVLAATAVLAQGGLAHAQDWQGAYLSGFAGYAFKADDDDKTIRFDTNLDGTFGDSVNTTAGANAFSPGFCNGNANGSTPDLGCDEEDGAVDYGIRSGMDVQFGSFVVGGLIEVSRNEIEDSVAAFSTTPAQYTMTRELTAMIAARLRGGFALSNVLVYGTGGYAVGLVDRSFSTSNGVNTFIERGPDNDAQGFQYGGGAEWAVSPNWRIGAEYIRTELSDNDYRVRSEGPAPSTNPFLLVNSGGTDFGRSDDKFKFDSIRLTLTYRLGG
jgi:outer membrane immunogenic protein